MIHGSYSPTLVITGFTVQPILNGNYFLATNRLAGRPVYRKTNHDENAPPIGLWYSEVRKAWMISEENQLRNHEGKAFSPDRNANDPRCLVCPWESLSPVPGHNVVEPNVMISLPAKVMQERKKKVLMSIDTRNKRNSRFQLGPRWENDALQSAFKARFDSDREYLREHMSSCRKAKTRGEMVKVMKLTQSALKRKNTKQKAVRFSQTMRAPFSDITNSILRTNRNPFSNHNPTHPFTTPMSSPVSSVMNNGTDSPKFYSPLSIQMNRGRKRRHPSEDQKENTENIGANHFRMNAEAGPDERRVRRRRQSTPYQRTVESPRLGLGRSHFLSSPL